MRFTELVLLAVALSMDAFAVSLCKGLSMPKLRWGRAFIIAASFGAAQALMPLIGFLIGTQFKQWIEAVDHWIAFLLLAYIGGKMLYDALRGGSEGESADACGDRLDIRDLLMLTIATSIDALAVGVTFAFLSVAIVPSVSLIGVTTFLISLGGVWLGNRFGARWSKQAEIAGGAVLILIGLKILLEHVGVL